MVIPVSVGGSGTGPQHMPRLHYVYTPSAGCCGLFPPPAKGWMKILQWANLTLGLGLGDPCSEPEVFNVFHATIPISQV